MAIIVPDHGQGFQLCPLASVNSASTASHAQDFAVPSAQTLNILSHLPCLFLVQMKN